MSKKNNETLLLFTKIWSLDDYGMYSTMILKYTLEAMIFVTFGWRLGAYFYEYLLNWIKMVLLKSSNDSFKVQKREQLTTKRANVHSWPKNQFNQVLMTSHKYITELLAQNFCLQVS